MAWKMTHSEVRSVDTDGKEQIYAELLCDTESDLPNADSLHLAPMSLALIASTHLIRVLNTKGEWK